MIETNDMKILLVEDDDELALWTNEYLSTKGFVVEVTSSGIDAIARIANSPPDLILLDGMLPDIDGLDVCRQIRPLYNGPIIMLTARDEEIDEVLGLEVGADDYVTKPVRARALLARIRGQIRRSQTISSSPQTQNKHTKKIVLNSLVIDKQNMTVVLRGEAILLSTAEFEVLCFLAERAGELVLRKDMISHLRGFDYDGFDRSIDLRVSRIRKKLGDDPNEPFLIKTVWGKGYLFTKDGW
ncbi:response regulator transcription factor [Glaciecola petra]|uniref:Response regulator transcription factor n=1 Tax=Glaciecola petra TaxID=3075602 RepID=A0ABU2ZTS9_9ALTE|nr:response regulator transcription factor [Aestuariibacter sp. P117]MDT0596043.1 response regulator transcription factor [Aestuariibacter sp. P117]